jgi:hypothetical protein
MFRHKALAGGASGNAMCNRFNVARQQLIPALPSFKRRNDAFLRGK